MVRLSILHDTIKIRYTEEGYLPYYPYHLISDEEMFHAFILDDVNYFEDNYPLPDNELKPQYDKLKSFIVDTVKQYLSNKIEYLPNWIYTYMLGEVININSDQKDIHDLLVLMNLDNLYDEFNVTIYKSLYDISIKYLGRDTVDESKDEYRPATIFGEPHVIKYLRIEQVSV